jgi:uncharacterized protein (UPF0261 family)
LRCFTDGGTPSRRNTVADLSEERFDKAIPRGRCAAPDTSHDDAIAADIAWLAWASSRPDINTVSSISGRGKTLIVTSVMAASVPNEPAMSLQRS